MFRVDPSKAGSAWFFRRSSSTWQPFAGRPSALVLPPGAEVSTNVAPPMVAGGETVLHLQHLAECSLEIFVVACQFKHRPGRAVWMCLGNL